MKFFNVPFSTLIFILGTAYTLPSHAGITDPCGSTQNQAMVLISLPDGSQWCVDQFQNVVCDSSKVNGDFFASCISRINNDPVHGGFPNGQEPEAVQAGNLPDWLATLQQAGLNVAQQAAVKMMFAHNQTTNALPQVVNSQGAFLAGQTNYLSFSISPLDPRLLGSDGDTTLARPLETRFITPLQAQAFCTLNGKVLPPEVVWRAAAQGSPICQTEKGPDHCVAPSGAWNMLGHMWEIVVPTSSGSPFIVKGIPSFNTAENPLDVFDGFPSEAFAHMVTFRCAKLLVGPSGT